MTYNKAKRELIDAICKDPAGFLLDQFKPGGAFAMSARPLHDVIDNPVIMYVRDNEGIRLELTVWDVGEESYASYVDRVKTVQLEDGSLVWQEYDVCHKPYTRRGWLEECATEVAIGDATCEWAEQMTCFNICPSIPTYAWFFPLGAKVSLYSPNVTMCASNRPNL